MREKLIGVYYGVVDLIDSDIRSTMDSTASACLLLDIYCHHEQLLSHVQQDSV